MKKLVLYGDSLFAGVGKDRILMFEEVLPGYDIYNCATGGWNTNDCVEKAPYIATLKPDVVVISLGTNDAEPWNQVPSDVFVNNIPKIISAFSDSTIVWFLPPPINEPKAKDAGWELTNQIVKEYRHAAKKVCEENDTLVIDSFAVFKPLLDSDKDYHDEDGIHFNELAYITIASELARLLVQD